MGRGAEGRRGGGAEEMGESGEIGETRISAALGSKGTRRRGDAVAKGLPAGDKPATLRRHGEEEE